MPGRNIYKEYSENSYYHVYNRGVNKETIFRSDEDFVVFLGLLKRYLSPKPELRKNRTPHPSYFGQVELLAYCLIPNHFHLFLYQIDSEGMKQLLKSVSVAYGMYFNEKYKRVGPVFQQRYRAVKITSDSQLIHVSRYIHLNPSAYQEWQWSSLPYYRGEKEADWLRPSRVLELHDNSVDKYLSFLEEYKDKHDELEGLKTILAG